MIEKESRLVASYHIYSILKCLVESIECASSLAQSLTRAGPHTHSSGPLIFFSLFRRQPIEFLSLLLLPIINGQEEEEVYW
jgi:hypothetical protein